MSIIQRKIPKNIKNTAAFIEKYGESAFNMILDMAYEADPLADAVIAAQKNADEKYKTDLQQGIELGVAVLHQPAPELRAFFEDAENIPQWVDSKSLIRGAEEYLTLSLPWQAISNGPGALTHTYFSPNITKILMQTGNLSGIALRRIVETTIWKQYVLVPGGLTLGQQGYIHTLQVRLLHARVRMGILKKGWETQNWGMPISQLDMVRTWLDFTYIPFTAMTKVGFEFNDEELNALYHLWQMIAKLLGIEARYIRLVTNAASAKQLSEMLDLVTNEYDENAKILTHRMLEAVGQILHPFLGLPENVSIDLMHSFCRTFYGDEISNLLEIRKNPTEALIPVFTNSNRYEKNTMSQDPEFKKKRITETLAIFKALVDDVKGEIAYKENLNNVANSNLPKTYEPGPATA
ncbi:oxygenase MpaB family protein [Acinetobacter baumannii]